MACHIDDTLLRRDPDQSPGFQFSDGAGSSPAAPLIENREGVNSFYEFGDYLPFRIFRICVNRKSITETMAFRWHDIAGDSEKPASYLD